MTLIDYEVIAHVCFHITFFLQKICMVFWIYRMYCISYFRLSGVLFKDPIFLCGWMGHALLYKTSYMFIIILCCFLTVCMSNIRSSSLL